MGGSGMQWSFSNTNSQFVSFKSSQERGAAQHKLLSSALLQRNLSLEKQGGSHHHHHAYNSWQQNETLKHSTESRMFPLASQTAPMLTPPPVVSPLNCPVVGSTDLRSSSNISTGPCQLTIFYNGSVCVYDNVSPDKAQAIMLLAGNGDSSKPNLTVPTAPKLQLQLSAVAVPKQQPLMQSETAGPVSSSLSLGGFSSSISLAPPVNVASLGGPVRPVPIPAHIKPSEGPKSSPNLVPSAVPQARRASLARFLEKRKGRVADTAPYPVSKNTSECSSAGPVGSPFGTNSANSSPLTATK